MQMEMTQMIKMRYRTSWSETIDIIRVHDIDDINDAEFLVICLPLGGFFRFSNPRFFQFPKIHDANEFAAVRWTCCKSGKRKKQGVSGVKILIA